MEIQRKDSVIKEWIHYFIIKKSKLFDATYYLLEYPDVRYADINPLWHFVRYGWKDGRNPSTVFDTGTYLKVNADVKQAGINPLVHYIKHGHQEGRVIKFNTSEGSSIFVASTMYTTKLPKYLQNIVYIIGERVYWLIPDEYRHLIEYWLYAHLGFIFRGRPDYENWLANQGYTQNQVSYQNGLINIETVEPTRRVQGEIAIHLHIFYVDLVDELVKCLKNMPFSYDLFISVTDDEGLNKAQLAFVSLPLCRNIEIKRVPNRGRNIAPMFCMFGEKLAHYDYIAHLHTKKSIYNQGATGNWRKYLYHNLMGSKERIRRIFTLMQEASLYGIVYPQNHALLPYWGNTWLANREQGRVFGVRLGINNIPRGYFDYPAGSMFWARGDALQPLFEAGIKLKEFSEETGQTDGTLAHTIERFFVLCSVKQGLSPAIIIDEEQPSWSAWRFDQYTSRPYQVMLNMLNKPQVKLIVFDIFDTLLSRPLLNPETIKSIVARRVGGKMGTLYKQYRALAEQQARHIIKQDVGLDAIYNQLALTTNLSQLDLLTLQHTEESVEEYSLSPRKESLRLYQDALATGIPVVLLSDMFLPKKLIEKFLCTHGFEGWHGLFVSNEIGKRKDTGELYKYVLSQYALEPSQMLVIGDNERSDVQIPVDMQASSLHLLRPIELARGLPRFFQIVNNHEQRNDIDAELTLGLVLEKNFTPILYESFDPSSLVQPTPYNLGYTLVGPLLVSFSNWLVQKTKEDNIKRLYFLSREGKLMKDVYDCWTQGLIDIPQSDYLIISRRAASVSAISEFDDILNIATTIFFPNTVESFLYTRYGLVFNDERWEEITESTGWKRDAIVEIKNKKNERLVPLLQMLQNDIFVKAKEERQALLQYLNKKNMNYDSNQSVVDIGFGGSIQSYLNSLLSQKTHGYYLMTDERASHVTEDYNVFLRGCFFENITQSIHAPIMYRLSFELEKLLSTTEPQVEYYKIDAVGKAEPHYRELSSVERQPAMIRKEIQIGAIDYATDARRIREQLLPDFKPSCWTAQQLMDTFLVEKSPRETELLSKIVLDDYYCGRDLVF